MSARPKIDAKRLGYRCWQSTEDLMEEVGGVTLCDNQLNYAYANKGSKILAVAHCDYVDCNSDHYFAKNGVAWSSRLDDRLGVYTILDVLPQLGIEVDILLTDGEESCNSTARFFEEDIRDRYNWIVQFDRHGTDVVTYEYTGMNKILKPYFGEPLRGSYSDICELEWVKRGAFNVGVAYYEEHTLGCYAMLGEYRDQIQKFARFYKDYHDIQIDHFPRHYDTHCGKSTKVPGDAPWISGELWRDKNRYWNQNDRCIQGPLGRWEDDEFIDANYPGSNWARRLSRASDLAKRKEYEDMYSEEDCGYFDVTLDDGTIIYDVMAPTKEIAMEIAGELAYLQEWEEDDDFTDLEEIDPPLPQERKKTRIEKEGDCSVLIPAESSEVLKDWPKGP